MSVLDKLFGRGNVTYHIAVAEALDSVAGAIFAEQIAFWQDRSEDGWVFRSTEEIQEYTGLKRVAQEGARKTLKNCAVMEEKRRGMPARLYYRLDLEKLTNLIVGTDKQECRNLQTCSQEPTNRSIEGVEREEQSSVETGEPEAKPQAAPKKAMTMGQFYNKELADRLKAKREGGKKIHSPTDREKKDFAAQFKAMSKDDTDLELLLAALDYQIAKAAGEIEGEPAAWCGFRTAFDRVDEAGGDWRNTTSSRAKDEPVNPHGPQAEKTKDRPYHAAWYVTNYGLDWEFADILVIHHETHTEIMEAIERGEA